MSETKRAMVALSAVAVLLAAGGCGKADEGGEKRQAQGLTGEDVRREVGEAYETTKVYLAESTEKMKARFDAKLERMDESIESLKEKGAAAGAKGKVYRDEALEVLKEKRVVAREKMEELREASGEFRQDAALKFEAAMTELEEAYWKVKESFGDDSQ